MNQPVSSPGRSIRFLDLGEQVDYGVAGTRKQNISVRRRVGELENGYNYMPPTHK